MSLVTEAYQKPKSAGRLFNCRPDNFDCVKCKNTVSEDSKSASFDKRDNRYNQKSPKRGAENSSRSKARLCSPK